MGPHYCSHSRVSYDLTIQSSLSTAQGCIGVLDVSVILMLLLLMAGDVELNPGPGKLKMQKTRETSLSADPDTNNSRDIVLDVLHRHYSQLGRVISEQPALVASELYSNGLLSSGYFDAEFTENHGMIMTILEALVRFRANSTSLHELMVQFCEVIREVSFYDHRLPEAIMRTLDNVPILANPSFPSTDPSSTSSSFTTTTTATSSSSSSFSSSFSSSSTSLVISSVEELIYALPTITDPVGFGLRLGVSYNRCKRLIEECGRDRLDQVRAVAEEWYCQSPRPTWNEVVEALYSQGLPEIAANLASKVGVRSPVSQQSNDSNRY